ncbi:MAG TPA: hypothetical protein VN113_00365, partial [Caulobacter sp.]|nr:hypothetical protein [Caulobacter sp.]
DTVALPLLAGLLSERDGGDQGRGADASDQVLNSHCVGFLEKRLTLSRDTHMAMAFSIFNGLIKLIPRITQIICRVIGK